MVVAVQDNKAPQRPAMNVPRQVLDAFEDLVANEDKQRTAATMLILQHVEQVLQGRKQAMELPEGVKYIVHRLVTGLASSRLKAREGFFSALCYLLRLHPSCFTPSFVLSLLTNKKSVAMKAVDKEEIRDQLLGELLLCGAVVRSGRAVGPEVLQRVVNQLCAMRTKKSYLDITASQFLVNLMESCEGNSMHEAVWESLQAELKSPVEELSPSQLWMRLVLLRKHRASPPVWLTSTLAPKNHEALGHTLMKIIPDLPKVHPLLEELVSSLAASHGSSSSSTLTKFWVFTLDHLEGNTSPGKLQILFLVLKLIVPHLRTAAEFTKVVTSSVVSLLLNSLTQHVPALKEAARGVTDALVQLVKDNQDENSELQLAVVRTLITPPGSVRFDQLAGHKVVALMVPHFTLKTIMGVTKTLLEVVIKDLEVANRNYASHTLGSLLGQPRACTPEAATWKKQQLVALLKAVVLTSGREEGDLAKDAFFKILGKQVGHIREYREILLSLVEEMAKELKAIEAAASPFPLNDKGKEQWRRVISRLAALKGKECEEGTEPDLVKTIFQVLYCQMALQLFVDVTAATESIEDFIACHKEVKKLGMLTGDDDEDEDDEDEDDDEEEEDDEEEGRPTWVEVVTELLLSLMTQEMHIFRLVVQGLFWLLIPLMTATALTILTDVLDTEKARDLVSKDGEEDDDEEGSDDDDEGEEEVEEEEPGEGEDPDLFTLKKKMFIAAGGIDVDVDMDSVSQKELDRMDERLGALFAEFKGNQLTKKKKRKKGKGGGNDGPQLSADEQSLMHFQTRVCDMLIVYIKAAPNLALQVGLVNPIYKALRTADHDVRQKDLQKKLVTVITVLEKKKKFNSIGEISVDTWKETVNEFFSLACPMPARFLLVTQSCYSQLMHCGRILLGMDEEAVEQPDNFLATTYVTHLETFFTKNQHLPNMTPFCEPCKYNMGGLWQVAATLLRFAFDPEVKIHKQAQALKALQQLYKNKALQGQRSRPHAAALEKDLWSKLVKALDPTQESVMNGQYMCNLLGLLHTLVQVDKQTEPQPSLPWGEVQGTLETFREGISKGILKPFRKEYNMFNEALRGLSNNKKRGVKRGAADLSEGTSQPDNQTKKEKVNKNSVTNTTSNLSAEEGGGKEKVDKKNKKNKKNVVKSEATSMKKNKKKNKATNIDNLDTSSQDNTSHCENTPQMLTVNTNGNDSLIQKQNGEGNKTLTKNKKKAKLVNSNKDNGMTDPETITQKKKKKKKNTKDKLTVTSSSTEEITQHQTEESTQHQTEESTQHQTLANTTQVKQGNAKKKRNKVQKRKQEQMEKKEEEETASLTFPVTPEATTKKKKGKLALKVNGKV